jgi:GT2 family glycosyltransferase
MQLSVVILSYNVRYFLEQCILSVQNAIVHLDAEIIVVDNNSDDDSVQMVTERFPDVKLIANYENAGFPKGNNIGVAAAKGKYLCILNPDTVVAEDTFLKILNFAETKNDLGIIGCRLVDGTGTFLPESKRGIPTPWVAFTKVFGLYKIFPRSRFFNQYYAMHIPEDQTGEVPILVGAFMIMERSLYLEAGGFDEDCFMYSDDIDLSYTVLKRNRKNYYFPETTVIHYKGESTLKDAKYMMRFQQAMEFFYQKHFRRSVFFTVLIKIGIVCFSILKLFEGKRPIKLYVEQYFLYSLNGDLRDNLSEILKNKVTLCDIKEEKLVNSCLRFKGKRTEIILDNHSISFKKCIQMMESFKNKRVSFKILPKNANFILGSNSKNDRGEIVKIR